ncbi:MAG: hypothetical protein IPL87_00105 [Candidatus Moraniibacteriota bacterium]|nr:MAG: hypothetical protein IPL87_00105 [Candidatus Moranbacteria bacterium]
MERKRVRVHDRMQRGYRYVRTEPMGKHFDADFTPDLSPKAMLRLGIFGGVYMRDCVKEFPPDWFREAKLAIGKRDPSLNFFGMLAGQSLSVWQAKGWIHPDDPRGWFQWYSRYFSGRRHPDDRRQIARWKAMRRHLAQISYHCRPGDFLCRPRQRQALLQWAYDTRRM